MSGVIKASADGKLSFAQEYKKGLYTQIMSIVNHLTTRASDYSATENKIAFYLKVILRSQLEGQKREGQDELLTDFISYVIKTNNEKIGHTKMWGAVNAIGMGANENSFLVKLATATYPNIRLLSVSPPNIQAIRTILEIDRPFEQIQRENIWQFPEQPAPTTTAPTQVSAKEKATSIHNENEEQIANKNSNTIKEKNTKLVNEESSDVDTANIREANEVIAELGRPASAVDTPKDPSATNLNYPNEKNKELPKEDKQHATVNTSKHKGFFARIAAFFSRLISNVLRLFGIDRTASKPEKPDTVQIVSNSGEISTPEISPVVDTEHVENAQAMLPDFDHLNTLAAAVKQYYSPDAKEEQSASSIQTNTEHTESEVIESDMKPDNETIIDDEDEESTIKPQKLSLAASVINSIRNTFTPAQQQTQDTTKSVQAPQAHNDRGDSNTPSSTS